MKNSLKLSAFVLALGLAVQVQADENHHHEEKTLKISAEAQKHLGIEFAKVSGKSPWTLSRTALVQIKDANGVYKKHEDAIEFIDVQILKTDKDSISVRAEGLEADDEVAVKGTKFIRIMESELNSEPAGHGH
ncbi:hypothetical protein [Bdellovibrio sp. HCB274]|uniref:hypothetical protein n=1 Tax=Bdellovibrio sp. HCB274 TaxID=3394361 RepID=UPI0039B3B62E